MLKEEYTEEERLNEFVVASELMRQTMQWLDEYMAFGDGLDSDLEYQKHLVQ